jgi:hypothetical protein
LFLASRYEHNCPFASKQIASSIDLSTILATSDHSRLTPHGGRRGVIRFLGLRPTAAVPNRVAAVHGDPTTHTGRVSWGDCLRFSNGSLHRKSTRGSSTFLLDRSSATIHSLIHFFIYSFIQAAAVDQMPHQVPSRSVCLPNLAPKPRLATTARWTRPTPSVR